MASKTSSLNRSFEDDAFLQVVHDFITGDSFPPGYKIRAYLKIIEFFPHDGKRVL